MVEGGRVLQSLEGTADFHGIVSYKVWKVWPIFIVLWRVIMRPTIEIASTILFLASFPYTLASEAIDREI